MVAKKHIRKGTPLPPAPLPLPHALALFGGLTVFLCLFGNYHLNIAPLKCVGEAPLLEKESVCVCVCVCVCTYALLDERQLIEYFPLCARSNDILCVSSDPVFMVAGGGRDPLTQRSFSRSAGPSVLILTTLLRLLYPPSFHLFVSCSS